MRVPASLRVLALLLSTVSATLPVYTGQYGVGIIDVEVPVSSPRNVSDFTYKDTGNPAFELETVLLSLYYPTAPGPSSNSTAPPHPWLPPPLSLLVDGFARARNYTLANARLMLSFLGGGLEISAHADAPLLRGNDTYPVLVFSGGDITLVTWYSIFCGELASRGNIVAAVHPRDGSIIGTQVKMGGEVKDVGFVTPDQLGPTLNATGLKMEQRKFRQAEIEEAITVLKALNDGDGAQIREANSRDEGQDLPSWKGRLYLENLVMAGHSFGATVALQVLAGTPNDNLPFHAGLVSDPGKESGPLNTDIPVPLLVADSEEWSRVPTDFYGQKHFDVVKSAAVSALKSTEGKGAWFATQMGTMHTSISDAGIASGGLDSMFSDVHLDDPIPPTQAMEQYVAAATSFLEYLRYGSREGMLKSGVTHPEFDKPATDTAQVNADAARGWQVHVAPEAGAGIPNTPPPKSTGAVHRCGIFSSPVKVVLFALLTTAAPMVFL